MWPQSGNPQYGSFIQKHIDAIGREGLEQSVLVLDSLDVHETDHGIPVRAIQAPSGPKGWLSKYKQVEEWMESWGTPDIVHAHGGSADTANIFLRLHMHHGHRIRRVVTEHGSQWIRGASRGARWTLRLAHARTAVSPYLAEIMSKTAQTTCIPNIIESSQHDPQRESSGPRHFLNVSDCVDYTKGLSELLDAWKQHSTTYPNDTLSLVGDGPDRESIAQKARSLNNVNILGSQVPHEVYETMSRHHALVVNSRWETFSMVIGEALERGLEVICTPIPGPKSVYSDYPVSFRQGSTEAVDDLANSLAQTNHGQAPVKMDEFRSSQIARKFTSMYQGLYRRR